MSVSRFNSGNTAVQKRPTIRHARWRHEHKHDAQVDGNCRNSYARLTGIVRCHRCTGVQHVGNFVAFGDWLYALQASVEGMCTSVWPRLRLVLFAIEALCFFLTQGRSQRGHGCMSPRHLRLLAASPRPPPGLCPWPPLETSVLQTPWFVPLVIAWLRPYLLVY